LALDLWTHCASTSFSVSSASSAAAAAALAGDAFATSAAHSAPLNIKKFAKRIY